MTDGRDYHQQRSDFIRGLVQQSTSCIAIGDKYPNASPRTIVQYWHDRRELPIDVAECIASWSRWTRGGFRHCLFDEHSAKAFIRDSLDARHEYAFERCYHPAMQADYFRLCYLSVEGGCYVDADDVCLGEDIASLFDDGRLKVQPLCYDVASGAMVSPSTFLQLGSYSPSWIFYFNNNPLVADRGHPIVERALRQATDLLERAREDALPEIQDTTGPGNLSRAIFEHWIGWGDVESDLVVLRSWESIAVSRWPLSYRKDSRNWRLSNQQRFRRDDE